MPPGVLFIVYDATTGIPEYIPPENYDVEPLVDELVDYIHKSDDHHLIKAAVIHYQHVTIHPFEDGNGGSTRLMSGFYLDSTGFDFGGIGSLEEYFAYNTEEYYNSLKMELTVLYYEGRNNPPHPEIWLEYFLRVIELYAQKISSLVGSTSSSRLENSVSTHQIL